MEYNLVQFTHLIQTVLSILTKTTLAMNSKKCQVFLDLKGELEWVCHILQVVTHGATPFVDDKLKCSLDSIKVPRILNRPGSGPIFVDNRQERLKSGHYHYPLTFPQSLQSFNHKLNTWQTFFIYSCQDNTTFHWPVFEYFMPGRKCSFYKGH